MKTAIAIIFLTCTAYLAATLQGSRLPEDAARGWAAVAGAGSDLEYRTGPEKQEYPPLADRALA
jgi:hypothetical protein